VCMSFVYIYIYIYIFDIIIIIIIIIIIVVVVAVKTPLSLIVESCRLADTSCIVVRHDTTTNWTCKLTVFQLT